MSETTKELSESQPHPWGTFIFGALLVSLGIAVLYFSKEIRSFALADADPGPKALPLICGALFIVGGIGQIMQSVFFDKFWRRPVIRAGTNLTPLIVTMVLLLGYIVTLEQVGFAIGTTIFLLVILLVYRCRWYEILLTSVVLVSLIYVLFEVVFKVSLPRGTLF